MAHESCPKPAVRSWLDRAPLPNCKFQTDYSRNTLSNNTCVFSSWG